MGTNNIRFIPYALLIFKSQKSLLTLSFFCVMTLSTAWFLGQTALIETRETSGVLMRETARLFCVFSPSFLLSSFLLGFQQRGELQLWLTKNLSRSQFLIESFLLGLILILYFMALSQCFIALTLQEFSQDLVLVNVFESLIFLSIALFFSLNLSSLLKICSLLTALYFLGRIKGLFFNSLAAPWLDYNPLIALLFKGLFAPIPDFSLFNTLPTTWIPLTLETLLSCTLFYSLTHWIFRKKCL